MGFGPASQLTLPHYERSPTKFLQLADDASVAHSIRLNLGAPELRARLWKAEQMAVMAVPEAAMDEHDRSMSRENQIRTTGERGAAEAIAQT